MIPTGRRLQFARGYIGLGMLDEAARELDAILAVDRPKPEVTSVWVDLHMEAKRWVQLERVGRTFARSQPQEDKGWISWAYALRELNRIEEAKAVLLEAEPLHGRTCGVLHYNLACYACLLGDRTEAKRRLAMACKMNREWKTAALDDPDLAAMRDDLTSK